MKRYLIGWLLLSGLAMAQPPVSPQGDARPGLSLESAIKTAMASNPTLAKLTETQLAAQARVDRVRSDLYPHVNLEAVGKDGPPGAPNFRLPGLVNAGFAQSAGGDVLLMQTFDFGRTSQRLLSQRFQAREAASQTVVGQARVTLKVVQNYGEVLFNRELVGLSQQMVEARTLIAHQAEARFRAGLTSRVDWSLTRADLAQAQADQIALEAQGELALAELFSAMGQTQRQKVELTTSIPSALEQLRHTEAQDVEDALRRRPEMAQAHAQVESQRALLGVARAGANPYLYFFATAGSIENLNGPQSTPHTYGLGVALSVPIFTAGGVQADIRDFNHQLLAALAQEAEQAQTVRLDVQQARLRLISLRDQRPALVEQLKAAEDTSKLARTRYQLGLGNIVEVQAGELALLRAGTSLIRNRAEIWLAWVQLQYATGRLNPEVVAGTK